MSDAAATGLDLREQIARIDRALAETHKLTAETGKLTAEAGKLQAEAAKLHRDRWLAPFLAIVTVASGMIAAASAVATFLRVHGAS